MKSYAGRAGGILDRLLRVRTAPHAEANKWESQSTAALTVSSPTSSVNRAASVVTALNPSTTLRLISIIHPRPSYPYRFTLEMDGHPLHKDPPQKHRPACTTQPH